ncbi:CoxG family protein [Peribacillus sp. SCS-155]|uniref:CoxG family protein n=1 Tax=Peribacillus sedimenti TaxID=3115297 RepID=UPI003906CF4C
MQIEHTIQLSANPDTVWNWVNAIERVATCIPGVEQMAAIEPGKQYNAVATDKVGPFKVSFPMELSVVEAEQPMMKIKAKGQDKYTKTLVHLNMFVQVNPDAAGNGTELKLDVDYQMKGKLATLGQGMVNRKFTEKVDAFAANLTQVLEGENGDAARVL